jgi:hypothetical protein
METLNLESSGPSVPTPSNYFTSILPPPATVQNEEVQMKEMGHTGGNNGVEVVHSGRDDIGYGELRINDVHSIEERRDHYLERRALS